MRDRFYTMRSFLINAAMECWLLHGWATGQIPFYDTLMFATIRPARVLRGNPAQTRTLPLQGPSRENGCHVSRVPVLAGPPFLYLSRCDASRATVSLGGFIPLPSCASPQRVPGADSRSNSKSRSMPTITRATIPDLGMAYHSQVRLLGGAPPLISQVCSRLNPGPCSD